MEKTLWFSSDERMQIRGVRYLFREAWIGQETAAYLDVRRRAQAKALDRSVSLPTRTKACAEHGLMRCPLL